LAATDEEHHAHAARDIHASSVATDEFTQVYEEHAMVVCSPTCAGDSGTRRQLLP